MFPEAGFHLLEPERNQRQFRVPGGLGSSALSLCFPRGGQAHFILQFQDDAFRRLFEEYCLCMRGNFPCSRRSTAWRLRR